jgi:hypothetical protein
LNKTFWWVNTRARGHVEKVKFDWRIILKRIFKRWSGGRDCIDLVQDMDRRRAVVNEVKKTLVFIKSR